MRLVQVNLGLAGDRLEWQADAAWRDMSVDLFYDPDHVRGQSKLSRQAYAKSICVTCRVIEQCIARVLRVGEPDGVWGGLTAKERDELHRSTLIASA